MIKELKIRVLPKQASSEYNITHPVNAFLVDEMQLITMNQILFHDRWSLKFYWYNVCHEWLVHIKNNNSFLG